MIAQDLLSRFDYVREDGESQWSARCPAHDDRTASLSVSRADDGKLLVHCHAGCSTGEILSAIGCTVRDLFPPSQNGHAKSNGKTFGRIVATYDYRDESGRMLYQSLRMDPKDFRQRRPKDGGGWEWKLTGTRRVLYRLPELLAADPAKIVWIPEGEKDVENLRAIGLVATCNVGGAGKWKPEYSEALRGRHAVILPDNDQPGREHAEAVANSLAGVAASVGIVALPGLTDKGDVSDWLAAGGNADELLALAAATPDSSDTAPAILPDNAPDQVSPSTRPSDKPEVILPGGSQTITAAAEQLGALLDATGEFYLRGGMLMRLEDDIADGLKLVPVKPAAFCSDLERVARLVRVQQTKDGEKIVPSNCSESTARLILEAAAFRATMPAIKVLAKSPVMIDRNGKLVQVVGYDRESGIMAKGPTVPMIDLDEARRRLNEIVADFDFATPGDRTRALAAILSPALVLGGLLRGRAPIDVSEADDSQAGKGYRNKITAGIYRVTVKAITQQPSGGVGSLKESFDAALVDGNSIISLDNLRGKLDLPAVESFATEDTYRCRIPYTQGIEIDPRHIVLMMTSNRAEMTIDLANRSSVVRIRKHADNFEFAKYPEGDILDRVIGKPGYYLAAVFAVISAWHERGMPEAAATGHDFRKWARVLSYITGSLLGEGPLLDGHRAIQERITSPGLNWLRDLTLGVQRAGALESALRAHDLLLICREQGIQTAGIPAEADLDDSTVWLNASRTIGRLMGRLLKANKMAVDAFRIERGTSLDRSGRQVTEYSFFSDSPNSPE